MGWENTPYDSQGAVKGIGASCAGFLKGLATELGYASARITNWQRYAQNPKAPEILRILKKHLVRVSRREALPADILLIRCIQQPQHLALFTFDRCIIHASKDYGVVEHTIDSWWSDRIIAVFRFPELV